MKGQQKPVCTFVHYHPMRVYFFILLSIPLLLTAQDSSGIAVRDTIHIGYSARYPWSSFRGAEIKEGFNQIYAHEDGKIIEEGYYKFRVSIKRLLKFQRGALKRPIKTGLWTHFDSNCRVTRQLVYDKKGRCLGETVFYPNGQIKEAKYRSSGRNPWIKLAYFENGDEVNTPEEWERYRSRQD